MTPLEAALAAWIRIAVPGQRLTRLKYLEVINDQTAVLDFDGPNYTLSVQFDWERGIITEVRLPKRIFPKQEGQQIVATPNLQVTEMLAALGILSMKQTIKKLRNVGRRNSENGKETG